MSRSKRSRREFFRQSALGLGYAAVPYWWTRGASAQSTARNDRPLLGAIGVGQQGTSIAHQAAPFGDIVADCDVDRKHVDAANARIAGGKAKQYGDYRKLLDRNDIEAVTDRSKPIPDVDSQHRSVSTCHLANISLRLGLKSIHGRCE